MEIPVSDPLILICMISNNESRPFNNRVARISEKINNINVLLINPQINIESEKQQRGEKLEGKLSQLEQQLSEGDKIASKKLQAIKDHVNLF